MSKFIDLRGQKFNKLTVIERIDGKRTKWKCQCECGNITEVSSANLKSGAVKSCGCLRHKQSHNYMHGKSKSSLYQMWKSMIYRCEKPNHIAYKFYGERGISVCDEWHDFLVFEKWVMETKPEPNYTIERIDVNEGYNPLNCTWIPMKEQANNRRSCVMITYGNETHNLKEWCDLLKLNYKLVHNRIYKLGWDFEKAISHPVDIKKSISRKEK